MDEKNCAIIKDLLPLYVDHVCSEESKEIVELHLKECKNCNDLYHMMKTEVKVSEDTDSSVIKGVKKRIFIEKLAIAVLVIVVIAGAVSFALFPLFMEKVNMNHVVSMEQISVEEDENGNLWLIRSGNAAAASMILPEIYQTDGKAVNSFSTKTYTKSDAAVPLMLKVVFFENRMDRWLQQIIKEDTCTIKEEKSIICSRENKEKYEKIVFEQENGKEKVLWERE